VTNRRWGIAAALVVIVGFAGGLAFALRSSPDPGVPRPLGAPISVGKLRVSAPRGFHNYVLSGGVRAPGAIGHVLTNFQLPARHPSGWPSTIEWVLNRWSAAQSKNIALKNHNYGPPSNVVELLLTPSAGPRFPDPRLIRLHLPLSPNQRWFPTRLASGAPFFRWGYLRFDHQFYEVLYWIGPDATANDRAAVLNALHSIRPV